MGQITEDFIMRAMRCCQLGQHPSMTVWEARQLLTAWVEWQACRGEVERLRSGCQFGTDGSAVAICHRLADALADYEELRQVVRQAVELDKQRMQTINALRARNAEAHGLLRETLEYCMDVELTGKVADWCERAEPQK